MRICSLNAEADVVLSKRIWGVSYRSQINGAGWLRTWHGRWARPQTCPPGAPRPSCTPCSWLRTRPGTPTCPGASSCSTRSACSPAQVRARAYSQP